MNPTGIPVVLSIFSIELPLLLFVVYTKFKYNYQKPVYGIESFI